MKPKTIREILGQLHVDANRNPGKESVDKALEAIQQLLEECEPENSWSVGGELHYGFADAIDQYKSNLKRIIGE